MKQWQVYSLRRRARKAFSLVELVIVITIIGVIAAVAVPRMSGAVASAKASGLAETLANVRKAMDVYFAEHGSYPGYLPGTKTPDGTKFVEQLTMYSDENGNISATPTAAHIYGPYLRTPFPRSPVNDLATVAVKADPAAADPVQGSAGWVAVLSHGYFALLATSTQIDGIVNGTSINKESLLGRGVLGL